MTTAGILVGSIYMALLGVAALGGITVFFLTAIAIPVSSSLHASAPGRPTVIAGAMTR